MTAEEGTGRRAASGTRIETAAAGVGMSVGRLEAFSDGVLAIVITLLVLEIKVPEPGDAHGHLGRALAEQWPHYVSFLLSFFVIGIIWLNHHATINLLRRTDHRI